MNKIFSQLSIVIVSFKSSEKLIKLISNLDKKFKIIIVENSQDKKLKKKLPNRKNLFFYYPSTNKGFGAGLNYGIKRTTTKYVLYLDIDTKINSNQILELFNKTKKTKNFGAITAKIKGQNYKDLILGNDKINKMKYVKFNTGCVMMFEKKTFNRIGGFDEKFFLYFEESDYYIRCINNNKKIFLFEKILVSHEGSGSIDKKFKQQYDILRNWHYCWSKFNYYCKHDGYVVAFSKTFPNLIKSLKGMIISIIKFNYQNFDKHLAEFKGILSAYFRLSSYYRINQYNL